MFGKISSLISYWKVLEVYVYKRFPSNKLPMWGMFFTYGLLYVMWRQTDVNSTTQRYKTWRLKEENRNPEQWRFNSHRREESPRW